MNPKKELLWGLWVECFVAPFWMQRKHPQKWQFAADARAKLSVMVRQQSLERAEAVYGLGFRVCLP